MNPSGGMVPAEEKSPLPEGSDEFAERFGLGAYLLVWDAPPAHILYTALLSVSLILLALGEKAAIDE